MTRTASHRFNNQLRYRDATDPKQTAITPDYIIGPIRDVLGGIDLDPCTTEDNPLNATRFYTPAEDGLSVPWDADRIYVNPPYGKAREPWVKRCIHAAGEGRRVVLLIPAATDTRIFQQAVSHASSVVFVRGRVKFGVLRPNRRQVAASHPSALLGFNVDLSPLSKLGKALKVR